MTPDQGSSKKDPEEQRGLIIRSTGLKNVAHYPLSEITGFSPELPQRLGRLNEVLSQIVPPEIQSIKIEMTPGEVPVFQTEVKHESGYRVTLDIDPIERRADFTIHTTRENGLTLVTALEDIKGFVKSNVPDKKAAMVGVPFREEEGKTEQFFKDLDEITEEELLSIVKKAEGIPYNFNIILQNDVLILKLRPLIVNFSDRLGLRVLSLSFKGDTAEVEKIIDATCDLFDKPFNHPFKTPFSDEEEVI